MKTKIPVTTGVAGTLTLPSMLTRDEEAQLRAAGWVPVVRWVDAANSSDVPLKALEVLAFLTRKKG
jgi:hypothetical protein